jgi:c-di-GMP-binding flagellar brake protein YcgR
MNDPSSRRVHDRCEIRLPVEVEHQGRNLHGTTLDLSLGGMLLNLVADVPIGATVKLRFSLPTQTQAIEATARVRWVDGQSRYGLQFDGLRAREVWALQQLFAAAVADP